MITIEIHGASQHSGEEHGLAEKIRTLLFNTGYADQVEIAQMHNKVENVRGESHSFLRVVAYVENGAVLYKIRRDLVSLNLRIDEVLLFHSMSAKAELK